MPVSWAIQDGFVVLNFFGTHTFDEMKQAAEAALAADEFRPGLPLLVDSRSSLNYTTTDEYVARVLWLAGLRHRGVYPRCAILTIESRSGMAERTRPGFDAGGMEMRVFLDPDEARAWLRVEGME